MRERSNSVGKDVVEGVSHGKEIFENLYFNIRFCLFGPLRVVVLTNPLHIRPFKSN